MISALKRRMLAPRAAARGMTVEAYIEWSDSEHRDTTRLLSDRQFQLAVLTQHAARCGRSFVRWGA